MTQQPHNPYQITIIQRIEVHQHAQQSKDQRKLDWYLIIGLASLLAQSIQVAIGWLQLNTSSGVHLRLVDLLAFFYYLALPKF